MRASEGADRPDQGSAPSERLTGLGLPRSSTGWVPEQPALAGPEPVIAVATNDPPLPTATPGSIGELVRSAALERAPLWATGLIERATVAGVAAVAAVILLVLVGGVVLIHRHQSGGGPSYSSSYSSVDSPAPDPVPSGAGDAASIVVDVGGRVRKPGLVTLPAGARVADAIDAAGGPLHHRELDRIDLAQRVTDGQLLLVGVDPAVSATGDGSRGANGPISLSGASIEALETLPGVGPVTAQKIVDFRTAHGGFTSVEQLKQVPGIGPAHFAEISPLVSP